MYFTLIIFTNNTTSHEEGEVDEYKEKSLAGGEDCVGEGHHGHMPQSHNNVTHESLTKKSSDTLFS